MRYTVQILYVERHHTPCDRSIDGQIKNVWTEDIDSFESSLDFKIKDVLRIKGKYYTVNERILLRDEDLQGYAVTGTILRVSPYKEEVVHTHGNDTWREVIPLFPGKRIPFGGGATNGN